MAKDVPDLKRRKLLNTILGGFTALGTIFVFVPFIRSLFPSDLAKALGAPVEVDITDLAMNTLKIIEWRGKPVWIVRRNPQVLESLAQNVGALADPSSKISKQPSYISGDARARKPEYLVLIGICPHLGCSPTFKPEQGDTSMGANWPGGFLCPCHGSRFDFSGRVYKNMPAPTNMEVPPYRYTDANTILIGES